MWAVLVCANSDHCCKAANRPFLRSFDRLVSAAKQREREGDPERLGGLEVDEQLAR
jgi:hypothetical protein